MFSYLFGYHLDGCPAPVKWQGIGKAVCGPHSLLSALETLLGLPPANDASLKRLIAYRNALAELNDPFGIYTSSFENDPLATSRLLLSWRDTLADAGWEHTIEHQNSSKRIQTIAAVEPVFQGSGLADDCHAGRISAILKALKDETSEQIISLVYVDPPEILPRCWRLLFEAMRAEHHSYAPPSPLARENSVLHATQAHFQKKSVSLPCPDTSLRVVSSATRETAAHALATQLSQIDGEQTLLIADPSELPKINHAFEQLDLAKAPSSHELSFALLQLPLLYLKTRFAPLNPQAYIEFLLHPIGPVPGSLSKRLADAINHTPGYGEHWKACLEKLVEDQTEEDSKSLQTAYETWILPDKQIEQITDGTEIAAHLEELKTWMARVVTAKTISNSEDASIWRNGAHSLEELVSIFSAEGVIEQNDVQQLLAAWLKASSVNSKSAGEVGSCKSLSSPYQVLEPSEHIIWWQPLSSTVPQATWTPSELDWFRTYSIEPVDDSKISLTNELASTQALLQATVSFTIYQVTQSIGAENPVHSLVTRIKSLHGKEVFHQARDLVKLEQISHKPLPRKRRYWNFGNNDLFPPRKQESFSSVSKVISAPFMWVLEYHARIRAGRIFNHRVKDTPLRTGSVLHALAEELFDANASPPWHSLTEEELYHRLEGLLQSLFPKIAAHYLCRGHESARLNLMHSAKQTFLTLIEALKQSHVSEIVMEKHIPSVAFVGGNIGGRIDMVGKGRSGNSVVIDLKLGGKSKRTKELAENRHLQLAVYGHLIRETEKTDVASAFYILSNGGTQLTRNEVSFPGATIVTPTRNSPEDDWESCWAEFEDVYQWRRDQLDRGKVEVPVPETELEESAPVERWNPAQDVCQYSPYDALTGWSPND